MQTNDNPDVPMDGLPKAVKVAGLTYSVEVNNDFTSGGEAYGHTSNVRLLIRLAMKEPIAPPQVRQALLHKLIHAIADNYGGTADGALSEHWTDSLASGLFQVRRDNPVATALILGGDEPTPVQEDT